MNYTPPTPEELLKLKSELGKSSTEMAELFGVSTGRQWRKYTSSTEQRDMGMHMLFFAVAQLELDPEAMERVFARMRAIGATVEIDKP
ncbi:transcriptional regulator [Paraburkholderia aromaticivorans]|uniref:Transcriptional regulator n=1 Tax=Paraburkholderia aromaticivorans TaxID=2026199 RepID=A0A248VN98_9BURK|nr:transcriptional regulator [Paraburkholderia aromaticivorans]ASW00507.1 transcriptional regulator [Paraburkholderia aromaticivorans]